MITSIINLLTFARIIIAVIIFALLAIKDFYMVALILFFIAGSGIKFMIKSFTIPS